LVPPHEQQEVAQLKESLGDWALGDVRKALTGGAKIGSFLLAAHFIDVLARLGRTRSDGKAAWDEFIPAFLPGYAVYAEKLYRGYRGMLAHSYSVDGFRFVDTEAYRRRHLTEENGERVLHLETFIEDLDSAWAAFVRRVEEDSDFRQRVLVRTRQAPLVTLLQGETGHASVAHNKTAIATHFGPIAIGDAAQAASGSPAPGWQRSSPWQPFTFKPQVTLPKMDMPKGRKRKRKDS
jgi:hypothetical protein